MAPTLSVLWALVPLVTLGWGTGFSFAYAAVRLRDAALGWWAAGYFVAGAASLALLGASDSQGGDWRGTLGALLLRSRSSASALPTRLGSASIWSTPSTPWRREEGRLVAGPGPCCGENRDAASQRGTPDTRTSNPNLLVSCVSADPTSLVNTKTGVWSMQTTRRLPCWPIFRELAPPWQARSCRTARASVASATSRTCRSPWAWRRKPWTRRRRSWSFPDPAPLTDSLPTERATRDDPWRSMGARLVSAAESAESPLSHRCNGHCAARCYDHGTLLHLGFRTSRSDHGQ